MTPAQKKAFVARMAAARARAGSSAAKPTTAIIVAPKGSSLGAPPSPPKKSLARRVGSAAAVAAVQEKQLLSTVVTGGAIGYLEQEGWLQELPEVQSLPIGKVGMLAVVAYGVNRWLIKDGETKKIVTGVMSAAAAIASYQMGKAYAIKAQADKLLKGDMAGDLENEGSDKAGI